MKLRLFLKKIDFSKLILYNTTYLNMFFRNIKFIYTNILLCNFIWIIF